MAHAGPYLHRSNHYQHRQYNQRHHIPPSYSSLQPVKSFNAVLENRPIYPAACRFQFKVSGCKFKHKCHFAHYSFTHEYEEPQQQQLRDMVNTLSEEIKALYDMVKRLQRAQEPNTAADSPQAMRIPAQTTSKPKDGLRLKSKSPTTSRRVRTRRNNKTPTNSQPNSPQTRPTSPKAKKTPKHTRTRASTVDRRRRPTALPGPFGDDAYVQMVRELPRSDHRSVHLRQLELVQLTGRPLNMAQFSQMEADYYAKTKPASPTTTQTQKTSPKPRKKSTTKTSALSCMESFEDDFYDDDPYSDDSDDDFYDDNDYNDDSDHELKEPDAGPTHKSTTWPAHKSEHNEYFLAIKSEVIPSPQQQSVLHVLDEMKQLCNRPLPFMWPSDNVYVMGMRTGVIFLQIEGRPQISPISNCCYSTFKGKPLQFKIVCNDDDIENALKLIDH